jgi:hypothetical protein
MQVLNILQCSLQMDGVLFQHLQTGTPVFGIPLQELCYLGLRNCTKKALLLRFLRHTALILVLSHQMASGHWCRFWNNPSLGFRVRAHRIRPLCLLFARQQADPFSLFGQNHPSSCSPYVASVFYYLYPHHATTAVFMAYALELHLPPPRSVCELTSM